MNPQVEKLEQLFIQGKNNPAALNTFFNEFWLSTDSLPRPEARTLVDHVVEWNRVAGSTPAE